MATHRSVANSGLWLRRLSISETICEVVSTILAPASAAITSRRESMRLRFWWITWHRDNPGAQTTKEHGHKMKARRKQQQSAHTRSADLLQVRGNCMCALGKLSVRDAGTFALSRFQKM